MNYSLLFAQDIGQIATIVLVVVVGGIRFLYSILKKPDVPPAAPQQNAPQTPEAVQQEIERFIRQAQGRDPKPPPPPKPLLVEQRPPEPLRQRLPAEERRETKPREQNRPKPKKPTRAEQRSPELPPTPLSQRHAIEAEVQQSLGENRPQRRSEQPVVPSIEQHMRSVFAHKVGSLDSDVEDRSISSSTTTAGKASTRLRMTREQIRQAVIFNEILSRPNFDE